MNSVFISIGNFEFALQRSTKELQVLSWCFLVGFVTALEFIESVGSRLPLMTSNGSLEKLSLPGHIFLTVAFEEAELLLRETTFKLWLLSF